MIEEFFKLKRANFDKLKSYGFSLKNDIYEYKTNILNGEFELIVYVSKDGKVSTKVNDKKTHEEYVLHLMKDAVGEFVGKVKDDFEAVLADISEKCFERDVFKSKQAKQIIEYVKNEYGDELEYLWEKFSNNAIWRRKDNDKWYGLMVALSKRKLGLNSDEIVDIIDVRVEPEMVEKIIDGKNFFSAYHMNKKHWITICLDGSVSNKEIFEFINESYNLAKK